MYIRVYYIRYYTHNTDLILDSKIIGKRYGRTERKRPKIIYRLG